MGVGDKDFSGGVPVVSTVTGTLRILYGTIQLLSAFALKVIGIFGASLCEKKNMGKWEKFNNRSSYHMLEGVKNFGRGCGEIFPFVNLLWWYEITIRENIYHGKYGNRNYSMGGGTRYAYTEEKINPQNNTPYQKPVYATYNRAWYHGELKQMHIINQFNQK